MTRIIRKKAARHLPPETDGETSLTEGLPDEDTVKEGSREGSIKEEGSGRIPDRFALYGDFRTGQCEEPDNLEERKGDDAVENPYGQGPERRADAPNPKRKKGI